MFTRLFKNRRSKNFDSDPLSGKPWLNAEIDKSVFHPHGMLGPEERKFLHFITRYEFRGLGEIIDAGAFIGASAYCLASGLSPRHGRRIHSFDYFKAIDQYVAEDITANIRPTAIGDGYLDLFEKTTLPFASLINVHPGDFMQYQWPGAPVEILFVDIAKTWELNAHLLREFFPRLTEEAVVIQQDYYHAWHPYIHASMEALRDNFVIVDSLVEWCSRVYRVKKTISSDEIESVISKLTFAGTLELLDKAIKRDTGKVAMMLRVIRLWHILSYGEIEQFDREYSVFLRRAPEDSYELWADHARKLAEKRKAFTAAM